MKLTAYRDNQIVGTVDFSQEIEGNDDARISFFIGRADDCHLILDDKKVSREHAEVIYHGQGRWEIKQSSAMSSLVINGMPCANKDLVTGDMISIGPFLLNVFIEPFVPVVEEPKAEPSIQPGPEVETIAIPDDLPEPEPSPELVVEEETVLMPEDEPKELQAEAETEVLPTAGEPEEEGPSEEEAPAAEEDEFKLEDEPVAEQEDHEFSLESDTEETEEAVEEAPEEDDFLLGDEETEDSGEESEFEQEADDMDFGDETDGEEFSEETEGDESFALEEFEDEDDDSDGATQVFQSFASFNLEIFGEHAPYDRYTLEAEETYIGRDPEKCQILLNDPQVSTVHAVITRKNITCTLKDLQSANGTVLNGARINQAELSDGDEFLIGDTTFTVRVGSSLLEDEKSRLMPVEASQEVEIEEVVEVETAFDEEEGGEFEEEEAPKSLVGKLRAAWKDPAKRKKLIFGAVGLAGAYMILGDSPKPDKPVPKPQAQKAKAAKAMDAKIKQKHDKETLEFLDSHYMLAKELFDTGKYSEAIFELQMVLEKDQEYKNARQLYNTAKTGLAKLEELERKRQEEIARKVRQEKVKGLVEKAKKATEEKNVPVATALFAKVLEIDPENFDIPQFKNELDAWKKEQDRIAMEKAQKEADRKRKVGQLGPSKKYFLSKNWYKAILKLEEFLEIKDMDEDLVKEAGDMLEKSKKELDNLIGPLLGKARSLREGQDFKNSYETYAKVLKHDPVNSEANLAMSEIKSELDRRAMKIYREALVAESLSLFEEAKEKFEEVKQVCPVDSDYYKKADDKLRNYIE